MFNVLFTKFEKRVLNKSKFEISLVKLQIPTFKYYLYQLKDQIYGSTRVAEVAAGAAALRPSHALPALLPVLRPSCGRYRDSPDAEDATGGGGRTADRAGRVYLFVNNKSR